MTKGAVQSSRDPLHAPVILFVRQPFAAGIQSSTRKQVLLDVFMDRCGALPGMLNGAQVPCLRPRKPAHFISSKIWISGVPSKRQANPIAGSSGLDRLAGEAVLGEVLPKPVGVVRRGAGSARRGEPDAAGFRQRARGPALDNGRG